MSEYWSVGILGCRNSGMYWDVKNNEMSEYRAVVIAGYQNNEMSEYWAVRYWAVGILGVAEYFQCCPLGM